MRMSEFVLFSWRGKCRGGLSPLNHRIGRRNQNRLMFALPLLSTRSSSLLTFYLAFFFFSFRCADMWRPCPLMGEIRSSGRKAKSRGQFLGKKTMLDRLVALKGFWLLHQMMRIRVVRCIRDVVSDGERKCLGSFVKLGIKLFNLWILATCFLHLFSGGLHHVDFMRDKRKKRKAKQRRKLSAE